MGSRTSGARRPAAVAACLFVAAAASLGLSDEAAPARKTPLKRALGVALAAGFVAAGAYYIHRRRAGRRLGLFRWRQRLPRSAERLSAEEFYSRLLDGVREGLARSTARRVRAFSPAELAEGDLLPPDADLRARWREACDRAARALGGGAETDRDQMRRDLDLARDLLDALDRRARPF